MSPTPSPHPQPTTVWSRWWRHALQAGAIVGVAVTIAPRIADMLPLPRKIAANRDDARAALDSIRLDDGMSEEEAYVIARVYFYSYWGLCGGPYYPEHGEGRWTFSILVGAAGMYAGDLAIEAATGRMTFASARNPRTEQLEFASLPAFRRDAVDHLGRRYWYERLRDFLRHPKL
jgi:hypothetical protein